ncbi:putative ABC transport system permease protein [Mucilaginibacter frigoritolerans]|uniref:Putative ABC transport system permease protein n=1 Tax=Mucilaginibacter frigoritolerans TaxID=652788 RepID=A0A562UGC3_9SPHI|nr:ABC transporter permease [Mucilaginibacter frigoritolerans]TWJ04886.1 putative ABC transport system permease protein [Mucilaginibacter frigoritolerans]
MIFNYVKIAWRNLTKQRLYSFINISGLAVGLAVCIMIMMYVTHEMSYDKFHKNSKRIFIPHASLKLGGSTINMEYLSFVSGPMIKESQPVVESYVRTMGYFKPVIVSKPSAGNEKISEDKLLFADPNFFDFFSFKLISGSVSDVLKKPFQIVLSHDMALKYFGSQSPVGKTIVLKTDSTYTYQVTGVAENCPSNSSIKFNFVASNSSLTTMKEAPQYLGMQNIGPGSFNLYLCLKHTADSALLRRNLDLIAKKDKSFDEEKFALSALPDVHLKYNFSDSSNIKYLKIFPVVAILILLLALFNYMSLSTSRATLRAKEVGVRKVSGASRKTIAVQFYIESALFTCISFIIGYLLCYAFKPWFLNVLDLKIDNSFLYSPVVLCLLVALLLLTILIAGSYPSFVLSAFKPVATLKGKFSKGTGGTVIRKIFTTLQFTISVALIICGLIINKQLYFFRHTDIGINKDNIIMIPVSNSFGNNYPSFKQDVRSIAGVSGIATSHYALFKGYDMFFYSGKTKNDKGVALASLVVDKDFITTMGLQLKYPSIMTIDFSGKNKVLINEVAAEQLHLPVDPVGSKLKSGDKVVGEFKNFNFASLQSAILPLSLSIVPDSSHYFKTNGCVLFAKINAHTNLPTLINAIKNRYSKYDKNTPFNYSFADDTFNEQFKAEDRLAAIFGVFTYITVIMATLGLFGLAAFTIEQRTKEIGVRKILGASVLSINSLISVDFLKLVLLAIVIASPIGWWTMNSWLQGFAYHISIQWWVFVVAALIAIITSVVTIGYHSFRAAIANPVNSLRSE